MTRLTIRSDHECSDPHWQAVMARVGRPFEEMTNSEKVAALDAINRQRSLTDEESNLLCKLVESEQKVGRWNARKRQQVAA